MHILDNVANFPAEVVERRFERVLGALERYSQREIPRAAALQTFLTVTRNYRPGLFVRYRVPGVPRTDNDLEHLFGRYRHHERRASGRKVPAANLVVHGAVRLPAGTASMGRTFTVKELAPADLAQWRELRRQLSKTHYPRVLGRRFHRNPKAFLTTLETRLARLRQSALPT